MKKFRHRGRVITYFLIISTIFEIVQKFTFFTPFRPFSSLFRPLLYLNRVARDLSKPPACGLYSCAVRNRRNVDHKTRSRPDFFADFFVFSDRFVFSHAVRARIV